MTVEEFLYIIRKLPKKYNFACRQKSLFLLAGGINTLVGFIIYYFSIIYLGLNYQVAVFFSLLFSIVVGFLQSKYAVFASRSEISSSVLRYLVLWCFLYFFTIFILGTFIQIGFSEIHAYVFTLLFIIPLSFLFQKYWVFSSVDES